MEATIKIFMCSVDYWGVCFDVVSLMDQLVWDCKFFDVLIVY